MSDVRCPACGTKLIVTADRHSKLEGLSAEQRGQIDCVKCWRPILIESSGPLRCSNCGEPETKCVCVRIDEPTTVASEAK